MTNSRESTIIIISIPPGNTLLVVISRSLCECHIKAKPASSVGEFATVPDGGVVPRAVRQNVGIRKAYGTAAANRAKRGSLHRLVVILTPLEIVDRGGRAS